MESTDRSGTVVYRQEFDARQAALYNAAVTLVLARGSVVTEYVAEKGGGRHLTLVHDGLAIDVTVMDDWEVRRRIGVEIAWQGAKLFHAGHSVRREGAGAVGHAAVATHVPGDWEDRLIRAAFQESPERQTERWLDDGGRCD